ncbi:hypothetical protein NSED_02145 [Candidatus Nitrosopumilus sediminis]|uniref:Uncharacterized protein n=2 Tax=Candidatus Nitrosopumilus sediminis TaxID=1229909 RepID=K0B9R2_9ARCH|nr:hypothetical protein NSED_02145 [Candidatus Nitrosopumilus sediminis]
MLERLCFSSVLTLISNHLYDFFVIPVMSSKAEGEEQIEEFAICVECGNSIEKCVCVCPYCGERDKCECALFDAATGG